MELEIVTRKENPLLDRIELQVLLHHEGEPTPKRDEVREKVATSQKAPKDRVVVDHLDPTFGMGVTRGYVKVYSNKQAALEVEEKPIVRRNKLEAPEKQAASKPAKEPEKEPKKEPAKEPEKVVAKEPEKEPKKEPAKEPEKEPAKEPETEPAEESAE
jgi:small subunit ribosomal protein S24e